VPRPDFGPIRARIAIATEQADRVEQLTSEWATSALRLERSRDGDGMTIRAEVTADPPVTMALALSDALQRSRTSLDDLVGYLRGDITKRSTFPIEETTEGFAARMSTDLGGLPEWAVTAVWRLQPNPVNPYRWIGDAVRHLDQLATLDRGRPLSLRGAIVDLDRVSEVGEAPLDLRTLTITSSGSVEAHFEARLLVDEPVAVIATYPFRLEAAGLARQAVTTAAVVTDTIEAAARRAGWSSG
jgi:hypothetical protein